MDELKKILKSSGTIAFFGGAGVSTESGIPDFKSPGGVYDTAFDGLPPEEILHKNFFHSHTDLFFKFYFTKMIYVSAKPNNAHLALAALEKAGRLNGVVTQNIDGLHQKADSKRVAELHGSVLGNRCAVCRKPQSLDFMLRFAPGVPICPDCGAVIKPDVVLYGEQLPEAAVNDAVEIIRGADCLIVGGTSLTVYPAASFLDYFRGNRLILINKDETPYDRRADLIIRKPIAEALHEAIVQNNVTV
jgi:NAD-dependent deacetylase